MSAQSAEAQDSARPEPDLLVVDLFEGRPVSNYWDELPDEKAMSAMGFRRLLEAVRDMTYEDLVAEVAKLPDDIRARLAEGPRQNQYSCAVCDAVGGPSFYRSGKDDPTDVVWRVYAWHEVPKLFMTNNRQLHWGELSDETYKRCVATYRAAGWTGEAPPPIFAAYQQDRKAWSA